MANYIILSPKRHDQNPKLMTSSNNFGIPLVTNSKYLGITLDTMQLFIRTFHIDYWHGHPYKNHIITKSLYCKTKQMGAMVGANGMSELLHSMPN